MYWNSDLWASTFVHFLQHASSFLKPLNGPPKSHTPTSSGALSIFSLGPHRYLPFLRTSLSKSPPPSGSCSFSLAGRSFPGTNILLLLAPHETKQKNRTMSPYPSLPPFRVKLLRKSASNHCLYFYSPSTRFSESALNSTAQVLVRRPETMTP